MSACAEDGADLRGIVQQGNGNGRIAVGAGETAATIEQQRGRFGTVEVGIEVNYDLIEPLLRQSRHGDIGRTRPINRDAELRQDLNQRFRRQVVL
jgi:hypothetical protein